MQLRSRRPSRGRPPYPGTLTPAEQRVLKAVRLGLTNGEIASRIGVSVDTVRYHLANIRGKLQINERADLASWEEPPREQPARKGVVAWIGGHVAHFGASALVLGLAVAGTVALTRSRPDSPRVPAPSTETVAAGHWKTTVGTPGLYRGGLTAFGPDGSLYLAFAAGAAGGRGQPGYPDVQLARLDPDGSLRWQKRFQVDGVTRPRALSVAADGALYLAGATSGHPDGQPNEGGFDAVLLRFSADGSLEWARTAGTPSYDTFEDISLLDDGTALAAGGSDAVRGFVGRRTAGMIRQYAADGASVQTADPGLPLIITRLVAVNHTTYVAAAEVWSARPYLQGDGKVFRADTNGGIAWDVDYSNALIDHVNLVGGIVYVTGQTGLIEFDGEPVAGPQDAFADGYLMDGTRLWRRPLSSDQRDAVRAAVPGQDGIEVLARLGEPPGGLEFDICPCPVDANSAYGGVDGTFILDVTRSGDASVPRASSVDANTLGPNGEEYAVVLATDGPRVDDALQRYRIEVTRYR